MPRYKLTIEYDGTPYFGFQKQDGLQTVQGVLEDALAKFINHKVDTYPAGRTDAGVHATGQVVHVDFEKERKPYQIIQGVNIHLLPHPVVVTQAEAVADDFHARFLAKKRHYIYRIINRQARLGLDETRAWHVFQPLDLDVMRKAADHFIGKTQDLSSFRSSECQAKSPVKTIDAIDITKQGEEIQIHIASPSFMHNQVRIMVGTFAEIGMDKRGLSGLPNIIAAKNRTAAGVTAPAHGLYFSKVEY